MTRHTHSSSHLLPILDLIPWAPIIVHVHREQIKTLVRLGDLPRSLEDEITIALGTAGAWLCLELSAENAVILQEEAYCFGVSVYGDTEYTA